MSGKYLNGASHLSRRLDPPRRPSQTDPPPLPLPLHLAGVPENSRYKTNPEFYEQKIKELESPEGKKRQDKIRQLGEISKRLGGSGPAALALAWAASNPNVSSVILGATKPEQVRPRSLALTRTTDAHTSAPPAAQGEL